MNSNIEVLEDSPANEDGMTESEKTHFGTYYGKDAYAFINYNDLWHLEYGYLRELMYAIRTLMKYHSDGITDEYFILYPKKYYVDKFELKSLTKENLSGLWEAIMYLIEFKERYALGWPEVLLNISPL